MLIDCRLFKFAVYSFASANSPKGYLYYVYFAAKTPVHLRIKIDRDEQINKEVDNLFNYEIT